MGVGGSKKEGEEEIERKNFLKVVAIGDPRVGKSCLMAAQTYKTFSRDYVPTVFDNYVSKFVMEDGDVDLGLWDTAGQEDYDRLRRLAYDDVDVFLLCFSVVIKSSYDNVRDRWIPELLQKSSNIRVVLCGCQIDLREDDETMENLENEKLSPIHFGEGQRLAQAIGATTYVECSAATQQGVRNVFGEVIAASMMPPPPIQVGELEPSGLTVKRANR